jgi:alkylation response protein AidB-like acyl-CoA dehydrogenase
MTTATTAADAIQAAADLAPLIQASAEEADRNHQLSDEVVEGLLDLGIYRYLIPQSLGGLEGDPVGYYRLVEALGRIDGSAAWCGYIGASAAVTGQWLSDEAAEQIWSDPRAILAGAVWPFNPATAEDGGYRVNGQWPYASGCMHATYMIGGCIVMEDGAPRTGPGGAPEVRFLTTPREQVEILDTWDVLGLAGTGSHDFVVHDLFVPEAYTHPVQPGWPKGSHFQGDLYRYPFQGLFAQPMGAVALGIAQSAIDHTIDIAQHKVPAMSQSTLNERPLFHLQIAEAVATTAAARAWLYQVVQESWEMARGGGVPLPQRNRMNLAAAHATKSARQAIETVYLAAGGSANYNRSPLPRAVRDIHALTQHIGTSPQQFPDAGRVLVGLEPENPLLLL